ncbi:MAG TPA: NAD-dependent epimerase/dehydratase family protein [Alphaproteobacteria bacterium]|nr:NAD-dependent epimerase/dehydratase family protein [Alphaproteobacteria bacterium]
MPAYLVTGGCGFIGSHLCDALVARGDEVRVLDDLSTGRRSNLNPKADLVVGDVADGSAVAQAMRNVDGCFHLAAVASVERGNKEWVATHRTNLTGTITVFDAARMAGDRAANPIPVVYASSAAVYGDNPDLPLVETAEARPLSAYGADKLGCEFHARVAGIVHKVPTLGLRFFNVYGPRQDPSSPYSGVISIFSARLRRRASVTILGDGKQERDFVFVGDVVRALMSAMANASTEARVFNVCSGVATSILGLAETIASVCAAPLAIEFAAARPGDIRRSLGSAARIEAALGWRAERRLEDGLRETASSL